MSALEAVALGCSRRSVLIPSSAQGWEGSGTGPGRSGHESVQRPFYGGAPCFCTAHDSSSKRVKANTRNFECQSCRMMIQTNYAETTLCPGCSNRDRRCLCCGRTAALDSSKGPVGGWPGPLQAPGRHSEHLNHLPPPPPPLPVRPKTSSASSHTPQQFRGTNTPLPPPPPLAPTPTSFNTPLRPPPAAPYSNGLTSMQAYPQRSSNSPTHMGNAMASRSPNSIDPQQRRDWSPQRTYPITTSTPHKGLTGSQQSYSSGQQSNWRPRQLHEQQPHQGYAPPSAGIPTWYPDSARTTKDEHFLGAGCL
eukprot:TRINITY_DN40321_c0_g1_i1.p1 TRINITY_DN40321_c0_g1~~TRINITY_DN40321_c0_g1_i1.p1  ORF type:complete len:339 (-),score=28.81 TRINITY_DN40321_c0_g1_i1:477-1397(-)